MVDLEHFDAGIWARAIGQGPARGACLKLMAEFGQPSSDTGFAWEGRGVKGAHPEADRIALRFAHIGVGMARALEGRPPSPSAPWSGFEADGYGFALALFRPRSVERGRLPALPKPLEGAMLHGVGRGLWYRFAGEARPLTKVLEQYAEPTWTGVGLAIGYTGGGTTDALARLLEACPDPAWLRRGALVGVGLRRLEQRDDDPAALALMGPLPEDLRQHPLLQSPYPGPEQDLSDP